MMEWQTVVTAGFAITYLLFFYWVIMKLHWEEYHAKKEVPR
jgi:hypothetical protein